MPVPLVTCPRGRERPNAFLRAEGTAPQVGLVERKRQGRVREAKGLESKSEEGREARGTTEPT